MSTELVSCCGLICSSCPAYLATQAGDVAAARATAEHWSVAYGVQCTVDDVWCDGCTTSGRKCAHCGECAIRACAAEHGLATCADCPDYGCDTLAGFFAMVPSAKEVLDRLREE